jgi:hypothetical protein
VELARERGQAGRVAERGGVGPPLAVERVDGGAEQRERVGQVSRHRALGDGAERAFAAGERRAGGGASGVASFESGAGYPLR